MESTQDSVIAYWNHPEYIEGYDSSHGPDFDTVTYEAVWRSELAQRLPAVPLQVLDLGAGTGFLSLLLAELGHRVRGIDLAGNMLARARTKAAARGLEVTFEKGDAQAPEGEPASVDAVTSRFLFWTLDDPAALLAASARLLRPGGTLIIFDGIWFPRGWDPATFRDRSWYDLWIAQYSPAVRRQLPLLARNHSDKVVRLVVEAGFTDVRARRLEHIERFITNPAGSELYAVWARKPMTDRYSGPGLGPLG